MAKLLGILVTACFGLWIFVKNMDWKAAQAAETDESLMDVYPRRKIFYLCIITTVLVALTTWITCSGSAILNLLLVILAVGAWLLVMREIYYADEFVGNGMIGLSVPVLTVGAIALSVLVPALQLWPFLLGLIMLGIVYFWYRFWLNHFDD